jgi:hypothetical protein
MTRFLQSDENPGGFKLEELLMIVRADVLKRSAKIAHDDSPEALRVMANNMKILLHLTEATDLALDSTRTLGEKTTLAAAEMRKAEGPGAMQRQLS